MRKKLSLILTLMLLISAGAWAQSWTNIIVNSDLEGTDRQCFFVMESNNGGMRYAHITDGIGVNDSRAIMVQSQASDEAAWWTQFDLRLPYELPKGTQYKLSFDYKASVAGDAEFQISNEPGEYVWWTLDGYPPTKVSFDTTWQHFEETFTVPDALDGSQSTDGDWLKSFQTIYACLSANKVTTQFIFDNIKVEIPSDVLDTLEPSPTKYGYSQYPVEINSLAIMGDFLGLSGESNWNLDNGWAMTQDSTNPEMWTLTKAIQAKAGTYEYKVYANGNLDDFTIPSTGNGLLVIEETGNYLITFTVYTTQSGVLFDVVKKYTVTLDDGGVDTENWTITPAEATTQGVDADTEIRATYRGTKRVKSVKAMTFLYSWESPEGTPVETGGTITYVNGDQNRLNYGQAGYYTICLNGKKSNLNDETASANAGRMVITLDEALTAGDVISLTGFINKNETKESSAYILFEKGGEAESEVFGNEANIDRTFEGSPKTVTVTVPNAAAGSKTITMTRGKTGTNLFITKLEVLRGAANN
jgi:hypothetical protein